MSPLSWRTELLGREGGRKLEDGCPAHPSSLLFGVKGREGGRGGSRCVSRRDGAPSGGAASRLASLPGFWCLVTGRLQELARGGTWPLGGENPSLSWTVLGGGFFNFLKVSPPFVKGGQVGEESTDTWLGAGGVHCHGYSFFPFFRIGGFSSCPVSGLC